MRTTFTALFILALSIYAGLGFGLVCNHDTGLITPNFFEEYLKNPLHCDQIRPLCKKVDEKFPFQIVGFEVMNKPITQWRQNKHISKANTSVGVYPAGDESWEVKIWQYNGADPSPVSEKTVGIVCRKRLNEILDQYCFSDPREGLFNKRRILASIRNAK